MQSPCGTAAMKKGKGKGMETIAVIEDDEYIGGLLEECLRAEGYHVLRAWSGTEALLLLEKQQPRLILLDLMLPGLSGEELLPQIKNIPVIIISAKAGIDEKVDLLLGGAADYITKPFEMRELLARIAVQLRRGGNGTGMPSPGMPSGENTPVNPAVLSFGTLSLDTETRELLTPEFSVHLTRTEAAILKKLIQNSGRPVSKSALLDDLSPDTPDCTESSLKIHISNLRRKMKQAGVKESLDSVWGIGFRLLGEQTTQEQTNGK